MKLMSADSTRCLVVREGVFEGATTIAAPFLAEANDPFAAGRSYYLCDLALRYGLGMAVSKACDLVIHGLAHSEFTTIWEGEVLLQGVDGALLALRAGESAVVPAGARLRWRQNGTVRRSFTVFPDHADDGGTAVVKVDPAMTLALGGTPAASVLLTEPPTAWTRRIFEARNGHVRIGVWQCTPYARREVEPNFCEFMHLLEGSVAITEAEGHAWTVRAGEAIAVPPGASNAWSSDETVRKIFCTVG